MKRLLTLFVVHALACLPLAAQSVGDYSIPYKANSTGPATERHFAGGNSKLWGTTSGGLPTSITLGTGLSFSGTTLNAASGGLTIGTSTITSGTSGRALYNNSGVLGELDLASIYHPLTATSNGGAGAADSGKLAVFDGSGDLRTASVHAVDAVDSLIYTRMITSGFTKGFTLLKNVTVAFTEPTGSGFQSRTITFPATTGTVLTTGDTGTVTSTMILDGTIANGDLSGNIALSKLAITGTADGTKFLRDDGSWQAVNLSAYLPLAGGTMTGALVLPAGSASAPSLTGSDTDSGIYFSTANQIDFATGGTRKWYIDSSGTLQGGNSSIQLSGNTLGTYFFARGGDYSIGASDDVTMSRDAAARMQMGRDHATTATNQTIKAHDVTTGTGASLDLRGGNGSTAGGTVTISTSATTTPSVRMTVKASGVINMSGMPTSSAGLSSGDLWNNSGVVNIVP